MIFTFLFVAALIAPFNSTKPTLPLGFRLGETKEQLELEYDVSVMDHNTGRVSLIFTLKNEGRLKPISSIDLYIPSTEKHANGGTKADLSLSLQLRTVDGNRIARVHINKALADSAELHLITSHLDGKQTPLTWYYHQISFADFPAQKQGRQNLQAASRISLKNQWTGFWETNWGPMQLQLKDDNKLIGTYGTANHSIQGVFDPESPNRLIGKWHHSNSNLKGRFQFQIDDEGRFKGVWTFDEQDPAYGSTNWTGEKSEPLTRKR